MEIFIDNGGHSPVRVDTINPPGNEAAGVHFF